MAETLEARMMMADVSSSYLWQPVRIGAGGLVTGMVTHPSDASVRYVRTDVGNAYRWDTTASEWKPMNVRLGTTGVPADLAAVPATQGIETIAIDPGNTSIVYMALPLSRSSDVSGNYPSIAGTLLKSTDGGRNFTRLGLNVTMGPNNSWRGSGERMAVDPNNGSTLFYGSNTQGLWRSTNGGTDWQQLTGGAPSASANVINVRIHDAGTSSIVYAVVGNGDVYRSTDNGGNWTNITSGTTLSGKSNEATLSPNGTLFVTQSSSTNLWRYNGSSWASASANLPSNIEGVAVDPDNTSRLFALAANGGLSRSLDGGATFTRIAAQTNFANTLGWLPQPVQPGWHGTTGIYMDRNSAVWMTQGNEGVLQFTPSSTNSESTTNPPQWTIRSQGIEEFVTHDVTLPKGLNRAVTAVHDASGFVITNPDTYSAKWINLQDQLIVNGTGVSWSPNDPNYIVISSSDINWTGSGSNYSGYSTDGGLSWNYFASRPQNLQSGYPAVSRKDPSWANHHIVILPNHDQPPYYSHDGGQTWTRAATFPTDADGSFQNGQQGFWNLSLKQRSLRADPFVPNKFYLKLTSGGFWQSTDGGVNWTKVDDVDLPEGTHHGQLEVNHNLQNDLWFVDGFEGAYDPQTWSSAAAHGVWHSTNGGDTWSKLSNVEHAVTIALGAGSGQTGAASYTVYIFGKISGDANWGVFRSTNGGTSWDRLGGYPTGIYDRPTSLGASWDSFGLVYMGYSGHSFVYGKLNNTVADAVSSVSGPASVTPGSNVTVNVNYSASTARRLEVGLKDPSNNWYWAGGATVDVPSGSGTRAVTFTVSSSAPAGSGYVYQARLLATDGTYITEKMQSNVTVASTVTGSVTFEKWTGISGTSVSNIPVNTTPSSTSTLSSLEIPTNSGDNYGVRLRGYITPATSGTYTFWIAGDDNSEFWLSTDANPANKSRRAYVSSWTNSREWNKLTTQKSAGISLTAGAKYYFEALMKEGGGGDNLAVAWRLNNSTTPANGNGDYIISGSVLSPYTSGSTVLLSQGKTATAKSQESTSYAPASAVDGNTSTRWASQQGSDDQWIQIDLGAVYTVNRVKLNWETAFGKGYKIQISNDGTNWTDIYSTTTGDGGIDDLTGLSGSGRYVRMQGLQRGTQWGYSLWEFEVYGY